MDPTLVVIPLADVLQRAVADLVVARVRDARVRVVAATLVFPAAMARAVAAAVDAIRFALDPRPAVDPRPAGNAVAELAAAIEARCPVGPAPGRQADRLEHEAAVAGLGGPAAIVAADPSLPLPGRDHDGQMATVRLADPDDVPFHVYLRRVSAVRHEPDYRHAELEVVTPTLACTLRAFTPGGLRMLAGFLQDYAARMEEF